MHYKISDITIYFDLHLSECNIWVVLPNYISYHKKFNFVTLKGLANQFGAQFNFNSYSIQHTVSK